MPKRTMPVLERESVRLRPLILADLPLTLAWRNQDTVRPWFFYSEIIQPEQHRAWFNSYYERDDDFVFVIEETSTLQSPVGQVAIYHVDWEQQRAEFGRLMIGDSRARGLGLAKGATVLALEFAERYLGMREIYLSVYESNAAALSIYRSCGFVVVDCKAGMATMIRKYRCVS